MAILTVYWSASVNQFIQIESPHLNYGFKRTFCNFIEKEELNSENLRRHIYLVNLETETTIFDSYGLSHCGKTSNIKNKNLVIVNEMENFQDKLPNEVRQAFADSNINFKKIFSYDKISVFEIVENKLSSVSSLPDEISNIGYSYIDNFELIGEIDFNKEFPDYKLIGEHTWNFCREKTEKNCTIKASLLINKNDQSALKFIINGTPLSVPYMLYKTANAQLWEGVSLQIDCDGIVTTYPLYSYIGETWEFQHRSFLAPLSINIKNSCKITNQIIAAEVTVKKITLYDGSKPFPYDGISQEKIEGFMSELNQSSFRFLNDIRVRL